MIKIGIIIVVAISVTPFISDFLKINKKLRAWVSLLIIIILNVINSLVFGEHQILEAIKVGIEEGAVAVGIFSAGKNTMQYVKSGSYKAGKNPGK